MIVKTGIMATKDITPNPSAIFPATPWQKAKMKVAVIGPEATPPESKAIPTKIWSTLLDRISDKRKPGTISIHRAKPSILILKMASITAKATPIDRATRIFFLGIEPPVTSSTCSARTDTAGSAKTTKSPSTKPIRGCLLYTSPSPRD